MNICQCNGCHIQIKKIQTIAHINVTVTFSLKYVILQNSCYRVGVSLNSSSYTTDTKESKISFKNVLFTYTCNPVLWRMHTVLLVTYNIFYNAYIQTPSQKTSYYILLVSV